MIDLDPSQSWMRRIPLLCSIRTDCGVGCVSDCISYVSRVDRMVTMVIQFSILIMLHSALVLVTTAEDYKCLPLVLRQACCWINETYVARNVIIFVSILINFLAAMINIVSGLDGQSSMEICRLMLAGGIRC